MQLRMALSSCMVSLRSHKHLPAHTAVQTERLPTSHARNRTRASAGGPTLPAPFLLATEARGAQHAEELAARLAAEAERAKRQRRVTARPLPVTLDVPVVPPRPEARALTLPDPFHLKSLVRRQAVAAACAAMQMQQCYGCRMLRGADRADPTTPPHLRHCAVHTVAP